MDGPTETQVADKHCFAAAFADERPIEVGAPELGVYPRVCGEPTACASPNTCSKVYPRVCEGTAGSMLSPRRRSSVRARTAWRSSISMSNRMC